MSLRRPLLLLALLGAVASVAVGCGGDDDDTDTGATQTRTQPAETPRTETTPPSDGGANDPEAAFLSFQSALADGDADRVCASLTPTATKQVEEASIGGSCEKWVKEIAGAYDEGSKAKLRKTKVDDVSASGSKATVKYTSPILNLPLEVELEKSGSTWRISKLGENV